MRRHLVAEPSPLPERPIEIPVRHPVPEDGEDLAILMLDAYRGTTDADGSETLDDARAEIAGYFEGRSGSPLLEHSYVAVSDDAIASAVLVSRYDGVPLVAYAMTAATHKGRGVATALTERVVASLHAAGERAVHLWVTAGNPAERIYERLGFDEAADGAQASGNAEGSKA